MQPSLPYEIIDPSASPTGTSWGRKRAIAANADRVLHRLAGINTQTPQLIAANDFATLKRAIDERLRRAE